MPRPLTKREEQITVMLAEGQHLDGIAQRLKISKQTVDAHKRRIYLKVDVHSRDELRRWALRAGLVVVRREFAAARP